MDSDKLGRCVVIWMNEWQQNFKFNNNKVMNKVAGSGSMETTSVGQKQNVSVAASSDPTKLLSLFEKITKTTSSIELQIVINSYVSWCIVKRRFFVFWIEIFLFFLSRYMAQASRIYISHWMLEQYLFLKCAKLGREFQKMLYFLESCNYCFSHMNFWFPTH